MTYTAFAPKLRKTVAIVSKKMEPTSQAMTATTPPNMTQLIIKGCQKPIKFQV